MKPRALRFSLECANEPGFPDRHIARKTLKRMTSRVRLPRGAIRLRGYLRGIFANGLPSWDFNFAQIERKTGMSHRTIERALAWLRQNETEFKFCKRRVGRSFAVRVSARQIRPPFPPHPLSPHGVSSGNNRNTAASRRASGWKPSPQTTGGKRLAAFAAYLARTDLPALHWDNCKVSFRFAHAFNFALAALNRGFERRRLVGAYEAALHQRHKDATDLGLNRGAPTETRFEPSSTVSLAFELLADGQTDSARRAARFAALAPQKAADEQLRQMIRAQMQALQSPAMAV